MTLPYWIQLLQALATPAIALLAVVIGLMQWRTNHQRAALDLFDKRWDMMDKLRTAMLEVAKDGKISINAAGQFAELVRRAALLFGPEVREYLESIRDVIKSHYIAQQHLAAHPEPSEDVRLRLANEQSDAMQEIGSFFERFDKLVTPYMRMHQKAPWF
jgi:hypothetical protein